MAGQAWYVAVGRGTVAGCCRSRSSVYVGRTGENSGCSKMEPLELYNTGKEKQGRDKRARITMREKSSSGRERAPPGLAILWR